jgi:hypothetical protein
MQQALTKLRLTLPKIRGRLAGRLDSAGGHAGAWYVVSEPADRVYACNTAALKLMSRETPRFRSIMVLCSESLVTHSLAEPYERDR